MYVPYSKLCGLSDLKYFTRVLAFFAFGRNDVHLLVRFFLFVLVGQFLRTAVSWAK